MIVFCMDDIVKYEQIPTYELNNLNVHFVSYKNLMYDYNEFILSFHDFFKTDSRSKYIVKGYEAGSYFLKYFFEDSDLIDKNETILGSKYKFSLQPENFYRNEGFDIWYYEDFEIKKKNILD